MLPLQALLLTFLDSLMGHLVLAISLLAVMDERNVRHRLKKLPLLLLSPLIATLSALGLSAAPELGSLGYFILSGLVLGLCTLWVWWAWQCGFWQALSATCMASIFQVADAALSMTLFGLIPLGERVQFAAAAGLHLGIGTAVALLLYKVQFGRWFRLLLEKEPTSCRTALLLLGLEAVMEGFLYLANGVQTWFLPLLYLLIAVVVTLMAGLAIYLARGAEAAYKLQAQQDTIVQMQLYEQDLEDIRREVRIFRHDYKNLLAGLSEQAEAGEVKQLQATLSELGADFDRRLGERIQTSIQIGNIQIPQVRSLLLSKLAAMGKRGVECRLEVLYPIRSVVMESWDFVRCLGILLDNAMEAVEGMDSPWVEVILLAQGERMSLRVANPWREGEDPTRFWEEGWSTKGPGRGLGLSSYLRILARYPNAIPCTSWESGVFVQELTMGVSV